jgi:hypothetical protein
VKADGVTIAKKGGLIATLFGTGWPDPDQVVMALAQHAKPAASS